MKGDVLAESLRVHKLLASAFKILHKPSLGGASRTTKFPGKEQPALARLSTHLFASLNTWVILTCWNCSRRYLQSFSKAAHELLMALLDSTRLTTTWASNSTCKWLIPSIFKFQDLHFLILDWMFKDCSLWKDMDKR